MSINHNSANLAVIEQITNNTTSWIGHNTDDSDVLCGQTFIAPSEGDLGAIEVFSSVVAKPGKVVMTLHNFDPQQKSWGPAIGSASVELNKSFMNKWIPFFIPGMHLTKGKSYGFKLESSAAYFGLGEAAGISSQPPYQNGQEWKSTNKDQTGKYYNYFSLAFKVGFKA
ncbi:hypothetical protein BH11BAC3_BH11BAC3_17940 [soil metagenome]